MKTLFALFLLAASASAAPLSTVARNVIPQDVQQLIVVDYRAINNSAAALELKEKVLPEPLKRFETALKAAGIRPESDIEQLVFASFRTPEGLRIVGIAQGQFTLKTVVARMRKQKIKGELYRSLRIYPMSSGMHMAMLDEVTMLFGDKAVVQRSLDVRDGEARSLNSNSEITDLMGAVHAEAIWSVLDNAGTNTMLKSALGDASELADYDMIKKRIKGSRYTLKFERGVDFDLDVLTSDAITAATLSSLVQAGVLFRKASASASEKVALDSVKVRSESKSLQMEFKTDETRFQALLNSDLFKTVSR